MRGGAKTWTQTNLWTITDFDFKHDYGKMLSKPDAIKNRTKAVDRMLKKLNDIEREKKRQERDYLTQKLLEDDLRQQRCNQQVENKKGVIKGEILNDLRSLSEILNDKNLNDTSAKLTWLKAQPEDFIPPEKKEDLGPGQINFYEFYFKDLAKRIKALLDKKDAEIERIKALLHEKGVLNTWAKEKVETLNKQTFNN